MNCIVSLETRTLRILTQPLRERVANSGVGGRSDDKILQKFFAFYFKKKCIKNLFFNSNPLYSYPSGRNFELGEDFYYFFFR